MRKKIRLRKANTEIIIETEFTEAKELLRQRNERNYERTEQQDGKFYRFCHKTDDKSIAPVWGNQSFTGISGF